LKAGVDKWHVEGL
jgi:hypothetical protein